MRRTKVLQPGVCLSTASSELSRRTLKPEAPRWSPKVSKEVSKEALSRRGLKETSRKPQVPVSPEFHEMLEKTVQAGPIELQAPLQQETRIASRLACASL